MYKTWFLDSQNSEPGKGGLMNSQTNITNMKMIVTQTVLWRSKVRGPRIPDERHLAQEAGENFLMKG